MTRTLVITGHGDGNQTRDFVFVEDVVHANIQAITTNDPAALVEAYKIGTGSSISIRELAEFIQHLTDTDADIVHPHPREGDIDHPVAEISKADGKLDFTPSVSLREGLERTIEWWQSDATKTKQPERQR